MTKDKFIKSWITDNAIEIVGGYEKGMLTLRALYYQLVALGMTNSQNHYKRVVNAMGDARRDGEIDYDVFSDRERAMARLTSADETSLTSSIILGKQQIRAWMTNYDRNRWENQPYYPEVFIEKKALEGVFLSVCNKNRVALGACKGYPSLTFLNDATKRFIEAEENGKQPIILYFGDYDPSGEDIPRAIEENIKMLGCETIQIDRIALHEHQVIDWNLPPAPTKTTDSRSAKWNGLGQVELDAVRPEKLQRMCQEAIDRYFDSALFKELNKLAETERKEYRSRLKEYVETL